MMVRTDTCDADQLPPAEYSILRGCSHALAEEIAYIISRNAGGPVLDVGCGPGDLTAMIASLSDTPLFGIDIDASRIAYARDRHPGVDWAVADGAMIDFADESFSIALITLAIQRFDQPDRVLAEVRRVLRPGGCVVVASPTPAQLCRRLDLRFFPEASRFEASRFPDSSALVRLVSDTGFRSYQLEEFSHMRGVADEAWMAWLRQQPYSSLRRLAASSFEAGLDRLQTFLSTMSQPSPLVDELVLVSAQK